MPVIFVSLHHILQEKIMMNWKFKITISDFAGVGEKDDQYRTDPLHL